MSLTTFFSGSVLSVWMIMSLRRIFASCHVVMLSIKLASMSGYRLEGITVPLVEQRYDQKHLFYNYLPHESFPPHLGCDNWCRQFHTPTSYIKKFLFFSFYDSKKKNTFPPSISIGPIIRSQSLFLSHSSFPILGPVVCFC